MKEIKELTINENIVNITVHPDHIHSILQTIKQDMTGKANIEVKDNKIILKFYSKRTAKLMFKSLKILKKIPTSILKLKVGKAKLKELSS